MISRRGIVFAALALFLIASSQGSQFSRDESQEDQETEFNLASTLTGGITSSRHRQRAHLNSPLYPGLSQLGGGYGATAGATGSIDDAHGHEQGGSSVRVARGHQFPAYPPPGFPGQQAPVPYPAAGGSASEGSSSGGFQSTGAGGAPGYPAAGTVPVQYPTGVPPGAGAPGYFPGTGAYPYPGVYLQQYPAYPQPAQFPAYGVVPGAVAQPGVPGVAGVPGVQGVAGVPGVQGVAGATGSGPATSSQNFHRYPAHNPADRNHLDHHFSMNTEYKEDGVHKGPFGVLNNHNAFGYGSGYGGGYNGAFNSPAY
ncbi:elastin isoform X2 [Drosophila biarmipes]|uniref:elastin isoform X2 n=1 Tax=Drosophila biarmipes TaxID=125945 RepID=UPI0007E5F5D3|nr:elastin isoform X2 [Drosophila biarmipes]